MSITSFWSKVSGWKGRYNDVLYTPPKSPPSSEFLIYFGGDTQDLQENMQKHRDSKQYIKWSLENTSQTLSVRFPKKHLFVIRPSRFHVSRNAVYSCFDNFVQSDTYGIPTFSSMYNALGHLQKLTESFLHRITFSGESQGVPQYKMEDIDITLLGFSKGCVVLNQLLNEFHHVQTKPDTDINVKNFINCIGHMWWLDGGHGGHKDTWITNNDVLKSFAKLRINVYIHVTPYQIQDAHRPWIATEEADFRETLRSLGMTVQHKLHFDHLPSSLLLHFNILQSI